MHRKTIGDQELALLQYIDEAGTPSVGEVAVGFGEPRGLARSTVLTMMERLRGKNYLRREQADGMYRYQSTAGQDSVVQGAIAQFVDRTLQGSVSPFVAYLSQRDKVSDDELAELEALVEQLQSRRQEG
ncbi:MULTISPECIES: BlaI/MecI/CopY family transcriptional regulator [unclassified Stenotrophomonas]|jgi:predicted transcriptional regulator|uniref:BlaI/MecI/CopY family transcriptional regulator n=1 Tax=unclassified Stenotrophomonas TaxID=196198 RepID=UPI0005AEE46A|nr:MULTISPECIES: BlaI/MecI/CopY family transcriptional regulator [unclassified Stenotrophomonas]KIP85244.1 methicillin resistance protein [Stenotrophomonas maltophilia]MBD8644786.1 BlaI/MecI/CopY family transcriptional regulator [Stenotrophomonas sp. CFBP 13724]MDY1034766.1 BlaI/MecI/CopY family transcriptional regulator [Stenotrophomonas sp. CFBP8980]